jgi:hypothetical protein
LKGIAICWSESDLFRKKEKIAINLFGMTTDSIGRKQRARFRVGELADIKFDYSIFIEVKNLTKIANPQVFLPFMDLWFIQPHT